MFDIHNEGVVRTTIHSKYMGVLISRRTNILYIHTYIMSCHTHILYNITNMYVCTHVCMCVHIHACVYTYMYVGSIRTYTCMCAYNISLSI